MRQSCRNNGSRRAKIFKFKRHARRFKEIVFIDGLTGEIRSEEAFEDVPESIRFAPNARGELEPVVKIVDITTEKQRTIKQFGRGDVVLRSTLQYVDD